MMRKVALNYAKSLRCILPSVRQMSSSSPLTTTEVDDKTGVAILTMNRLPINGLNLDMLNAMKNAVEEIENNKSKGLILTSSAKNIFTAGVDIHEIYKPDPQRVRIFWSALQDVWLKLYGLSLPSVALINGHAPAGGCLFASCCDYRVMLPNFIIGLNEAQLGFVCPERFVLSFLNCLPRRTAELALTQAKLFTTDEALQAGLIDEVAADKEQGLAQCYKFFATFKKVNPLASSLTKLQFRREHLETFEQNREQDVEDFVNNLLQTHVQEVIGVYFESLQKKKTTV